MVFNYSSKYYIVALSGTLIIWVSGYMDLSSQQQVKGTAQAFDPKTVGNCREVEAAAEILTRYSSSAEKTWGPEQNQHEPLLSNSNHKLQSEKNFSLFIQHWATFIGDKKISELVRLSALSDRTWRFASDARFRLFEKRLRRIVAGPECRTGPWHCPTLRTSNQSLTQLTLFFV